MTLIIGIRCSNGIVIGSDGAATLSALGQPTATQPTPKLDIFDHKVIVGVSGPFGLGQIIKGQIEEQWKGNKLSGKSLPQAMVYLRTQLWDCCLRKEVEVA